MTAEPVLIKGALASDDRGHVGFVNDFTFTNVKRFYTTENHKRGFIRAWHGHKLEAKYITAVKGTVLICCVKIDAWEAPSKKLPVQRFVLTEQQPAILAIPAGYANGTMSLTKDAKLVIFSTTTLEESKHDDYRYHARYWDPWTVEER